MKTEKQILARIRELEALRNYYNDQIEYLETYFSPATRRVEVYRKKFNSCCRGISALKWVLS